MTAFFPIPQPEQSPEPSLPSNTLQFPALLMSQVQQENASAEYYLTLGNTHYNSFLTRSGKQDLDMAINCYRRALETNPSLAEGYVKLASALFDKGEMNVETAIQYCHTALSMNPELGEANLYLGYFLGQNGQVDAAMNAFKNAITKAPNASPRPRMAYGKLLLQKAFSKTTAKKSPAFAQRYQWAVQGVSQMGLGLLQLPKDKSAFQVFKTALVADAQILSILNLARVSQNLGLMAASVWFLDLGCQQLPKEAIFFHTMGDLYHRQKEQSAAIYYYDRALELDPQNPVLLKKLGWLYQKCNDTANAIRHYQGAVDHASNDTETMYQLAKLLTDQGEYVRALYYFKEIAVLDEGNPYVHSNMAYVLFKLEDFDGAIQEYKTAIAQGDDPVWTATVAQTLGTIYYQLKHKPQAALEMFQLAYDLDPTNLDCIAQLADLYVEQGHYESAIGAYQYLLSFDPENAECLSTIGYLLWQLDKNNEAIESYQKSIELDSNNPIAFNNLGVIYLDEFCQPLKALQMFENAFELNAEYTLAVFNQGRALEALGKTTDSAKCYSQAAYLNKENPELETRDIQERLERLFQV